MVKKVSLKELPYLLTDKNKIPTSSDNSSSEVDSPKDKTTVQPIENSNEENIPSELDSTTTSFPCTTYFQPF